MKEQLAQFKQTTNAKTTENKPWWKVWWNF
jgi:hypothetical protein